MGLDKVLDFLRKFWGAHSPAVFVSIAVLLAVNFYALPAGKLIDVGGAWSSVKAAIDSTLSEMGIKVERGYVVVAFVYLALLAVEWLSTVLKRLPGLQQWYSFRISNEYTAEQAGRLLGAGVELYEVERRLDELLMKYRRSFSDRKERSPYEWLAERASLWSRYYGLAVLVAVALAAWAASGTLGAIEARKLVHLAVASALLAAAARWRERTLHYRKEDWESGAALRAYEAELPRPAGALERGRARGKAFAAFWKYRRACRQHPAELVERLVSRFPKGASLIRRHLNRPRYWQPSDWRVFASAEMRLKDEDPLQFRALRTDEFEERFAGLLECRGSGLFMVSHREAGLAPATRSGGGSYCIASRHHDGSSLRLVFERGGDALGSLSVSSGDGRAAHLIDLGPFPIERVAQFELPPGIELPMVRSKLKDIDPRPGNWTRAPDPTTNNATARPGHSYLWLSEVSDTADVRVGLQCFAIEGRPGCLLVAFRILGISGTASETPPVLPWWRARAWAGLINLSARK